MHNDTSAPLTTHEHVKFPDGSHVIVHSTPGGVQVTGMIGGEYIEYAGCARDAREQARLLTIGAPDALWAVPDEHAARIGAAMDGAATAADLTDEDEDVHTRTVPLDGGTAIVEHVGDRVEVTVRIGHRLTAALVLSHDEASALGAAIARPDGPTIGDLFTVADAMHADASALVKHWGTAEAV